ACYRSRLAWAMILCGKVRRPLWLCCTPALDRAWAIQRDLGERFLCVRWHRRDGPEVARRACAQRGHEKEITHVTKQLGGKMVSQEQMADPPAQSTEQCR